MRYLVSGNGLTLILNAENHLYYSIRTPTTNFTNFIELNNNISLNDLLISIDGLTLILRDSSSTCYYSIRSSGSSTFPSLTSLGIYTDMLISYDGLSLILQDSSNNVYSSIRSSGSSTFPSLTSIGIYTDMKISYDGLTLILVDSSNNNVYSSIRSSGSSTFSEPSQIQLQQIANICFAKGTPILTDQGLIAIDKIDIEIHSINQKKIVDITKTVSKETFLVCFEKDALDTNSPTQKTIISQNHLIFYEGTFHKAKWFLTFSGVKSIPYNGETLYNVLLEKHDIINVNNLICETLRPVNPIAKFYTKQCKLSPQDRDIMVNILKGCLDRNDIATYHTILKCC
jgi:hypothetical protein